MVSGKEHDRPWQGIDRGRDKTNPSSTHDTLAREYEKVAQQILKKEFCSPTPYQSERTTYHRLAVESSPYSTCRTQTTRQAVPKRLSARDLVCTTWKCEY